MTPDIICKCISQKKRNFVQEILEILNTKRGDKINKVMSTIHLPVERRPEYRPLPTHRVCQHILGHKKKQTKQQQLNPKYYFILTSQLTNRYNIKMSQRHSSKTLPKTKKIHESPSWFIRGVLSGASSAKSIKIAANLACCK